MSSLDAMDRSAPEQQPAVEMRRAPAWFSSRLRRAACGLADQICSVGGMFAISIALARVGTKEEYGVYTLSLSLLTFLTGMHNAAILETYTVYGSGRYNERLSGYRRFLRRQNVSLLAVLTAALVLIWLLVHWLHPSYASPSLLGMAFFSGMTLAASFERRTFFIERRPEQAARLSIIFLLCCLTLLAVALRTGLLSGFSAFAITGIAWSIALLVASWRGPGKLAFQHNHDFLAAEPKYWREHWKYSRWVFITALIFQFCTQAYFWVVAALLSVKDVAALRALYNLALPVDQVFAALTMVILPPLALRYAERDFAGLRRAWIDCALLYLFLGSCFAIVVALSSHPLMHFVYGGKFDDVASLLRLYVLLPVIMGVGHASNVALKAAERPQSVFYAYLASAATTFAIGILLVLRFGLPGAIYGSLLSGLSYSVVLTLTINHIAATHVIPYSSLDATGVRHVQP